MCIIGIKENSNCFKYIKNQTEEICMIAIEKDLENIIYVDVKKFPRVWEKYVLMYK